MQGDLSLRTRIFGNATAFQPCLLSGLGASLYEGKLAGYVLVGPAFELNYKDVYFLLSGQYRLSLSSNLNNHYYYSIGIAGLLAKAVKKKTPVAAVKLSQTPPRDRDGDGIVDSLDSCPDQPGLALFHGCPDSDGDGIIDKEDHCPTLFGIEKYKGCPIPDSDKDGINDEEDQCPLVAGVARYKGCPIPDTDKDGINDEEDSCVNVAGVIENHGCPPVSRDITQKIERAATKIFFKTGSHELLPKSFPALNEVVAILQENKTFKLSVNGHTDDAGSEQSNQILSENRARAVADYLISKGIEGSRLTVRGFGMSQPVADNKTAEGRAQNRRVELKVY
jgi:outer membrane protein OmpA-like peptidoglycan-associated protein